MKFLYRWDCLHSRYSSFFKCQSVKRSQFRLLSVFIHFIFIFLFGMSYFSASRTMFQFWGFFQERNLDCLPRRSCLLFPQFVKVWFWNVVVLNALWQFFPFVVFESPVLRQLLLNLLTLDQVSVQVGTATAVLTSTYPLVYLSEAISRWACQTIHFLHCLHNSIRVAGLPSSPLPSFWLFLWIALVIHLLPALDVSLIPTVALARF